MAKTHADALGFLAQWYDETIRTVVQSSSGGRQPSQQTKGFVVPGFDELMRQAQAVSDFLAAESEADDSAVLAEISTIRTLVEGLDAKMTELSQAFTDLNAAIDADAADKQALHDEVANLQAQIATLQDTNTADEAAVEAANAAIADAVNKVEEAAQRLQPLPPVPPVDNSTPVDPVDPNAGGDTGDGGDEPVINPEAGRRGR